jgi:hypothetical protein
VGVILQHQTTKVTTNTTPNQRRTTRNLPIVGARIKRRKRTKTPVDLGMAAMANPILNPMQYTEDGGEEDRIPLVANRANLNHPRQLMQGGMGGMANLEKIITCIPTMGPITQPISRRTIPLISR